MVFAKTWEDFEIAAEALLMEAPEKCRYSMRYAHSKQTLILKVTNNAKVSANIPVFFFLFLSNVYINFALISKSSIEFLVRTVQD